MAGDRARNSYNSSRQYRELLGLQGRVLLEADINEGQRIFSEETREHALDFVGPCGTPDDGYKITAPPLDFQIGPGTMYTGGVRTTLGRAITYSTQPDWLDNAQPQPWTQDLWRPPNQLNQGNSHVMLLLREQEIVATEDPALREVALGGPDSAARTRIIQRVVAAQTDGSNCTAAATAMASFWSARGLIYDTNTASLNARAGLRVSLVQNAPPPSPCDPPAASGYLGADNQMIRVQLVEFEPGRNRGRLVWAFNNGSILYRVKALDATTLELASRPVSSEFEPRSGQVVQVLLSAAELAPPIANIFPEGAYAAAITGHRATLGAPYAAETRRVTLPAALPAVFPIMGVVPPLFLRLWDGELDFELNQPVTLPGTGLQVTISAVNAGALHLGNYWSFAVRPLTPNAVYPERYLAAAQPPDGPRMWVCPLAVLHPAAAGGGVQADDCRVPFNPLTTPNPQGGEKTDCCCIKVKPEDGPRLQQIIDTATGASGTGVSIHFEPGLYRLRAPLIITEKHRGLVLQACTGAKPILAGGEDPRFVLGMIIGSRAREVEIRGLEFRMAPAKIPNDMAKLIATAGKSEVPGFSGPPRAMSIAIRILQCLSFTVENCDFRMPEEDGMLAYGILMQGDNGKIAVKDCRFDGVISESIGVCLAPILLNVDGAVRHSSTEWLVVSGCLFARCRVGILLTNRPLLTFIENNVTRYVRTSLGVLWFEDKVIRVRQIFELMFRKQKSKGAEEFVASLRSDLFVRTLGFTTLVPLGDLGETPGKPDSIYTLLDLTLEAATQLAMTPPTAPRLTVEGNHFDSRQAKGRGGDTLIWDLTSATAFATVTGNTMVNNSELSTAVVLDVDGFNITGNVIRNEAGRATDRKGVALIVQPGASVPTDRATINLFTVTGNTVSGATNLVEFPREEWVVKLPKQFAPLLTWEFFNTIS